MLLFFRLLLYIFLSIVLITTIIIFSRLKINIEVFEFNTGKIANKLIYTGKIEIWFLGKIKVFSKKIDYSKMSKIINKNYNKIKNISFKHLLKESNKRNIAKEILKTIKKIQIEKLNLYIQLDTESVILTSYLVALMSAIIPNMIKDNIDNNVKESYEWKVTPRYQNSKYINLKINSIISIKIVHIINMFKVIGGMNSERTSNRRLNANCYGKY